MKTFSCLKLWNNEIDYHDISAILNGYNSITLKKLILEIVKNRDHIVIPEKQFLKIIDAISDGMEFNINLYKNSMLTK